MSFNIFFNLQGSGNPTLPLLVSQKSNTYQSLSTFKENKKTTKFIDDSQPFCLPEEIQQKIYKLAKFCCWRDEITLLQSVSPVKIGSTELWAIDLWRLLPENRKLALSYHGRKIFDQKEYDTLKKIIPEEMKQDLVIHRLPLNDEVYGDWGFIPGGRAHLRFFLSPGLGVITTVVGGLIIWSFGQPVLDADLSFTISGSIGSGITLIGTAIAYARHRWFLAQHSVAIQFRDV